MRSNHPRLCTPCLQIWGTSPKGIRTFIYIYFYYYFCFVRLASARVFQAIFCFAFFFNLAFSLISKNLVSLGSLSPPPPRWSEICTFCWSFNDRALIRSSFNSLIYTVLSIISRFNFWFKFCRTYIIFM